MDEHGISAVTQNRYEIMEKIGSGGYSTVYKCLDTHLNRILALKRLHNTISSGDSLARQMWAEAMMLAEVHHPNIVTVFDAGIDERGPYVVTEWLDGDDLLRMVERRPFDRVGFEDCVCQTMEALVAAHHVHLLHRDLKPQNIIAVRMPSGNLHYKVLDFGLSTFIWKSIKPADENNYSIYGSINYVPPEQLLRESTDERTDLYAMGCIYYYLLAGRHAYEGDTADEIAAAHLHHWVRPLYEVRPDIPGPMGQWVMDLMARKPERRPASALAAYDRFLQMIGRT